MTSYITPRPAPRAGATACSARSWKAGTSSTKSSGSRPAAAGDTPTFRSRTSSSRRRRSRRRGMAVLFISDLHLSSSRPGINQVFFQFLRGRALRAPDLYILGDLFEYWAGDDDIGDPFNAQASGARLVDDPVVLDLFGKKTVLTHGDALCTDDREYQAFRKEVRSESWKRDFLAQPLTERKQRIAALRARSEIEKKRKPAEIMDVNAGAVESLLRAHGYPRLIHGHTH